MTHKLDDMIEFPKSQPKETYKEDLECEMVMVKIPRCTQWIDTYDEPVALGWHLEKIHMTWAHLEKKQTRLQLYTKVVEEKSSQWLETALEILVTPSGLQSDGVRNLVTMSGSNRLKEALKYSTG
ncbi:hypothetical protein Tco_0418177 [Tanacetum coccineum]